MGIFHKVFNTDNKSNDRLDTPELYSGEYLLKGKNIIVYGYGEGYTALDRTVLSPLNILPKAILDQKFEIAELRNKIQFSKIELYLKSEDINHDDVVIISIGNINILESLRKYIKSFGFENIIWAPDIYEFSLHHFEENFVSKGINAFVDCRDEIDMVYDCLDDNKSKELFETLLKRYAFGKPIDIPFDSFENQYLPKDLFRNDFSHSHYLCCGAFDGDSIKKLYKNFGKFKNLYAFEPDEDNFNRLSNYLSLNPNLSEGKSIFPCGVYNKTRKISFSSGQGLSSNIDPNGEVTIQVSSVDQTLINSRITYITMDVEGAELEALHGAKQLIKSQRPYLAISVYHYPRHLWEIASFLRNLDLKYKFYLRNYSGYTFETVLYAVPELNQ